MSRVCGGRGGLRFEGKGKVAHPLLTSFRLSHRAGNPQKIPWAKIKGDKSTVPPLTFMGVLSGYLSSCCAVWAKQWYKGLLQLEDSHETLSKENTTQSKSKYH